MVKLIQIFDEILMRFRKRQYEKLDPQKIKLYKADNINHLFKSHEDTYVPEGYSVLFWNKKYNYVDHIAIFPKQEKKQIFSTWIFYMQLPHLLVKPMAL